MIAGTIMAASLAGCGGGSGDDVRTGTVSGAPISGLDYETATQSGKTTADGSYRFRDGETVTFSLGGVAIGSVDAAARLDLPAVVGVDRLPGDGDTLNAALYSDGESTSLNRLVNVLVLFESLDLDRNPLNGIEIPDAVAARVSPSTVDLDMSYWDFAVGGNIRDGIGLPGLLRGAASAGELDARPVANAGRALNRLYEALGAPFSAAFALRSTIDNDADGVPNYVRTLNRQPDGRVLTDEYDTNGDGTIDLRYTYDYNANGAQLGYEYDDNGDGVAERTRTREFDAFGVQTLLLDVDGTGFVTQRDAWQLDTAGRLLRRDVQTRRVDRSEIWIVDENGLRSTYEFDADGDGQIEQRSLLFYPEGEKRSDRWTRQERDTDLDGVADAITTREFDAAGRTTLVTRDDDNDGVADFEERQTFDAEGRIVAYSRDNDGGGIDYAYRRTYADDGLQTTYETDQQGDGVYEQVRVVRFDADGRFLSETRDNDGDGQVDWVVTRSYNAAGKVEESVTDSNNDGTADSRDTFEYDAAGNLSRLVRDSNADGIADSVSGYEDYAPVNVAAFF